MVVEALVAILHILCKLEAFLVTHLDLETPKHASVFDKYSIFLCTKGGLQTKFFSFANPFTMVLLKLSEHISLNL
tara:strand:- start:339 stop:563 length:225 start_codon:yes stop_codon:yes gene_type:complete